MRNLTALLGVAGMLTILPATPVFAQVVDTHDGICNMIVPDANGALTGALVFGTLFVRTNNSWTTMTCHFDLPDELAPSKATHARDFACGIVIPPEDPNGDATIVQADETRASASSGGRMVMTCRLRKS